jgi:hypothetical protein
VESTVVRTAQKTAAALEIWAEARERAIAELTSKAAALELSDQAMEAKRLRAAVAQLRGKLLRERKRVSELRAMTALDPAPPGPAVDREVA